MIETLEIAQLYNSQTSILTILCRARIFSVFFTQYILQNGAEKVEMIFT